MDRPPPHPDPDEGTSEEADVWTCPTCEARSPRMAPHRPFCSERCRLIDLGRWFNGEHAVPGEPAVEIEGLEGLFSLPAPPDGEGAFDERDA